MLDFKDQFFFVKFKCVHDSILYLFAIINLKTKAML